MDRCRKPEAAAGPRGRNIFHHSPGCILRKGWPPAGPAMLAMISEFVCKVRCVGRETAPRQAGRRPAAVTPAIFMRTGGCDADSVAIPRRDPDRSAEQVERHLAGRALPPAPGAHLLERGLYFAVDSGAGYKTRSERAARPPAITTAEAKSDTKYLTISCAPVADPVEANLPYFG